MKEYHVEYSKRAQKQIRKLDKQIQRLLFAWIDKNLDSVSDTGNLAHEWRYRIGEYRLLCDIQDDRMIILALEFRHRRSVYNKK